MKKTQYENDLLANETITPRANKMLGQIYKKLYPKMDKAWFVEFSLRSLEEKLEFINAKAMEITTEHFIGYSRAIYPLTDGQQLCVFELLEALLHNLFPRLSEDEEIVIVGKTLDEQLKLICQETMAKLDNFLFTLHLLFPEMKDDELICIPSEDLRVILRNYNNTKSKIKVNHHRRKGKNHTDNGKRRYYKENI